MINIVELPAKKVPTTTSLFITCPYNQTLIDMAKLEKSAYWHKDLNAWEFPLSSIEVLVDNLQYTDEITINQYADKKYLVEPQQLVNYKTKPFSHQVEAIKFGLTHQKWLLLDEPGAGKTLSLICLAEELHARGLIKHCLIVCGVNSIKSNWEAEIKKHSNLDCIILGQYTTRTGKIRYKSLKDRAEQAKNKIDQFFIITNIESFQNKCTADALLKSENDIDMIVIDEVHKMKNSQSVQSKELQRVDATYKVGMTGTLILNNPIDCYFPLMWTKQIPGPKTLTNFKDYYCITGGNFSQYEIVGFKHLDVLQDIISNCSLRRKTEDVLDLPEKTIIDEFVDMDEANTKVYEQVLAGLTAKEEDSLKDVAPDIDKVQLPKGDLLAMATRLKQATACPQLLSSMNVSSTKVERACDLAEEIISNGNKVIISCSYKETVSDLANRLNKYNPIVITGDTKLDIEQAKADFASRVDRPLMIFTWQKMGISHTLTAAHYMICVDTAYTYGDQDQTERRIYRQGANQHVFIYRLFCKNTWDEHCLELIKGKQATSDVIIDNSEDAQVKALMMRYLQKERG